MTWTITDLLLWQPVPQGMGLASVAEVLVSYCGAYLEAFRNRQTSAQSYITSVDARPIIQDWPIEGGPSFFAVECVLTVDELLTS